MDICLSSCISRRKRAKFTLKNRRIKQTWHRLLKFYNYEDFQLTNENQNKLSCGRRWKDTCRNRVRERGSHVGRKIQLYHPSDSCPCFPIMFPKLFSKAALRNLRGYTNVPQCCGESHFLQPRSSGANNPC